MFAYFYGYTPAQTGALSLHDFGLLAANADELLRGMQRGAEDA